jgi:hypothetical protein
MAPGTTPDRRVAAIKAGRTGSIKRILMPALADAAGTALHLDIETGRRRRAIQRRTLEDGFFQRLMLRTIRRVHDSRLITLRGALQTGCRLINSS